MKEKIRKKKSGAISEKEAKSEHKKAKSTLKLAKKKLEEKKKGKKLIRIPIHRGYIEKWESIN